MAQCDTMAGIRFCECRRHSEDPFVYFGAKPTQRACARDLPQDRKRTNEGRSERETEGDNRQERAVKRRSVKEWEQGREETSLQKSERRLLRPVDQQMPGWPTREDKSVLLVAWGSFARVHARVSPQKHRMHQSVNDFSLLPLGTNPNPWFFVFLFFHPLGCVFCVLVKECEISLARDEKNHWTILMVMSSLDGWDSGGRPAVYFHNKKHLGRDTWDEKRRNKTMKSN